MMQKYENNGPAPMPADEKRMVRRLQLARAGAAGAPPTPMVGAVIVHDGRILGEGYHARCGTAHAEVNAIRAVRPDDHPLLKASTLYVSLEPCAHYGRTPPCAELIVRTGIGRVVVGCIDPFARVSGRGIDILRRAGIDVVVGVREAECRALNSRFFTCQTQGRPYITLKWAASADGFIDRWRMSADEGPAAHLSSPRTLLRVHRLRAMHQAILVGHATLRLDRPALTVRHWAGNDPMRIVLGAVAMDELPAGWTAYADIDTALAALSQAGIQSLLVEGGERTLQSFIDRGLWDEAWEECAPIVLGEGVPMPKMPVGVPCENETHWGVAYRHWRNSE